MVVRIFGHHLRQPQLVKAFTVHRHADQAAGMCCHKINCFRGNFISGNNDVTFIFTILIIHHNDHFPLPNILYCIFNFAKFHSSISF